MGTSIVEKHLPRHHHLAGGAYRGDAIGDGNRGQAGTAIESAIPYRDDRIGCAAIADTAGNRQCPRWVFCIVREIVILSCHMCIVIHNVIIQRLST